MMFPKDNTNYNGEVLCSNCRFGYKTVNDEYCCIWDKQVHKNVGVCRDYEGVTYESKKL